MRVVIVYGVFLLLAGAVLRVAFDLPHLFDPVVAVGVVLTALLVVAPILFNVAHLRTRPGETLRETLGRWTGYLGLAVFALAPSLIAVRGIAEARIPAFGSRPDILWIEDPAMFVVMLTVWIGIGAVFAVLLRKVVVAGREEDDEGRADADRA